MMNFAGLFKLEKDTVNFDTGELIIEKGCTSKVFYVVLEGSVEIRYKGQVLSTEGEGGIFGELSLVDNAPASADVVATSPVKLAAVSENRFQFLVQQHPFFAISVMKVMAERIRHMNRLG